MGKYSTAVFWGLVAIVSIVWFSYVKVTSNRLMADMVGTNTQEQVAASKVVITWETFYDVVQQRTDPERVQCAKGLVAADNDAATAALVALMREPEPKVREQMIEVLQQSASKHPQPILDGLKNPDLNVRNSCMLVLSRVGMPVVPGLILVMQDLVGQSSASQALAKIGKPVLPYVLPLLNKDSDVVVFLTVDYFRNGAADLLGKLADKRATKPLMDTLVKYPSTRAVMVSALANIVDPVAEKVYIDSVNSPTDASELRAQCAESLGGLATPTAIAQLERSINSDDMLIREGSSVGFSIAGPITLPVLQRVWATGNSDTKEAAIAAMGGMRNVAAVPLLSSIMKSAPTQYRILAAEALGKTLRPEAVPVLMAALGDSEGSVAYTASQSLSLIGQPAVMPLVAAMASPNVNVAYLASEAISKIANIDVKPLGVSANKPGPQMMWAIRSLANVGTADAAKLLTTLSASNKVPMNIRWVLAEALMKI